MENDKGYQDYCMNFSMDWFNELLNSMDKNCSHEQCTLIMDQCAEWHYKAGYMEQVLEKYIGDLDGFIEFSEKEHKQVITYDKDKKIMLVDENKDHCVCPVAQCMKGKKISPALCNCSAGMAERMVSKVVGYPVKAQIVSSIIRGDKTCIYEIRL
jgi:hypothetical protein